MFIESLTNKSQATAVLKALRSSKILGRKRNFTMKRYFGSFGMPSNPKWDCPTDSYGYWILYKGFTYSLTSHEVALCKGFIKGFLARSRKKQTK